MPAKKRKSTVKKTGENEKPTCVFCKQPGLLEHEIPLPDDEREELQRKKIQNPAAYNKDPNRLRPVVYDSEFEIKYGGWLLDKSGNSLSCHQQCLIGSPTLFRIDDENHEHYIPEEDVPTTMGEYGFHPKEILKEVRRANKLKCDFCKKSGANIGCNIAVCKKKYHYPCAVEANYVMVCDNKSNPSFCIEHSTKEFRHQVSKGQPKYCLDVCFEVKKKEVKLSKCQEYVAKNRSGVKEKKTRHCGDFPFLKNVEEHIEIFAKLGEKAADDYKSKMSEDDLANIRCPLCFDEYDDITNIVLARCCPNAHFHRTCMTKQGVNSGLLSFKCPLCGDANREIFLKNSIAQGVYCPNRDASWEINDEFVEQLGLLRPMSCYQGDKCKYPDDIYSPATHNRTSKEIILCHDCGNNGSHIDCDADLSKRYEIEKDLEQTPDDFWDWKCSVCAKADSTAEAEQPALELRNVNENSVGYESDSSIVVSAPVSNMTLTMHREREPVSPEATDEQSNDSRVEEHEDDENKSQNSESEKSSDTENKLSGPVESIDLTNSDIDEEELTEPLSERQNNDRKETRKRKRSTQESGQAKRTPKKARKSPKKSAKNTPDRSQQKINTFFKIIKSPSKTKSQDCLE